MPHRLKGYEPMRAYIQFITSARTPYLIYQARQKTGELSNTQWLRRVIAEALSRDLDIPLQELLDELPPGRTTAGKTVMNGKIVPTSAPTVEEVV